MSTARRLPAPARLLRKDARALPLARAKRSNLAGEPSFGQQLTPGMFLVLYF
jgi:hypothetical protein